MWDLMNSTVRAINKSVWSREAANPLIANCFAIRRVALLSGRKILFC